MKLLIAGLGYVGRALGQSAVQKGWQVWGLRRRPEAVAGVSVIAADMLDPSSLKSLPPTDYAVFMQAPSQPGDDYQRTYLEATRNLLHALDAQKPKKLLFVSSTGVYGEQGGAWVDENTPLNPKDENGRTLLETEQAVLKSGHSAMVLRLSGIYGPARNRVRSIKEGRVKPVFSGTYMNRVHLEDVLSAIFLLLENGTPGEIYLASDDEPCTEREFYTWLKAEGPQNDEGPRGKRCSNKKLKGLGWKLLYPSYQQGYTTLI